MKISGSVALVGAMTLIAPAAVRAGTVRNGQFAVFALIAALVIGGAAAVIALSMGVLGASEFPESRAVEIARGYADAVNRQSAVANCGVHPQARRIVCMVAEGITTDSAERFAGGLEQLAHKRGIPTEWAVTIMHEEGESQ